jgi:tetratricopeptide (TPR) repeat protein
MDYKEIFDRYLDGTLSGGELIEFEKLLREDPDLARELDQYKKLDTAAQKVFTDDSADKQAMDDVHAYKQQDIEKDIDLQNFRKVLDQADRRRLSPIWYAAAVVLAGAITTAIVLLAGNPGGMTEMYATYYEEYHPSEQVFEITRTDDDLYFAVRVYESGDYPRAALLFNQLADSTAFAPYSHFYAGMIYIHQGKWELAIEYLNQAVAAGESEILIHARWYLGLCYLRIENAAAAREQFESLCETKNEYSKRSGKILRYLD